MPPHPFYPHQPSLQFSPVRNSYLFAIHWLDRRLPDEPEWAEHRERAADCLDALARLWSEQSELVARYGSEAMLEKEWTQPALEILGWHSLYQTFIQHRKPDYALFLDKNTPSPSTAT